MTSIPSILRTFLQKFHLISRNSFSLETFRYILINFNFLLVISSKNVYGREQLWAMTFTLAFHRSPPLRSGRILLDCKISTKELCEALEGFLHVIDLYILRMLKWKWFNTQEFFSICSSWSMLHRRLNKKKKVFKIP